MRYKRRELMEIVKNGDDNMEKRLVKFMRNENGQYELFVMAHQFKNPEEFNDVRKELENLKFNLTVMLEESISAEFIGEYDIVLKVEKKMETNGWKFHTNPIFPSINKEEEFMFQASEKFKKAY
jgi:hypothetical protein